MTNGHTHRQHTLVPIAHTLDVGDLPGSARENVSFLCCSTGAASSRESADLCRRPFFLVSRNIAAPPTTTSSAIGEREVATDVCT